MRRVFIIRRDLHMSPGKLAAMVGHMCEAYWTRILTRSVVDVCEEEAVCCQVMIPKDIWDKYVAGIFTKTICEARNLNNLMKAKRIADELGLKENEDYGFINDNCLTELIPENADGTTTVGMWFRPLDDDVAHSISKKFPLFGDHIKDAAAAERMRRLQEVCEASKGGLQTFKSDVKENSEEK